MVSLHHIIGHRVNESCGSVTTQSLRDKSERDRLHVGETRRFGLDHLLRQAIRNEGKSLLGNLCPSRTEARDGDVAGVGIRGQGLLGGDDTSVVERMKRQGRDGRLGVHGRHLWRALHDGDGVGRAEGRAVGRAVRNEAWELNGTRCGLDEGHALPEDV